MSLYRAQSSLLSVAPRVSRVGTAIVVRTAWLWQLLSLFLYLRTVRISPALRRIDIDTRWLWLWHRHHIVHFDAIANIEYSFHSVGTSWVWFWRWGIERSDQVESFRVGVALRDSGQVIPIATFRGEGSSMTGLTGVLLGDSLIDAEGTQEDASRQFVELLERTLEVPIGRPLILGGTRSLYVCGGCGRSGAPGRASCLYCGGAIERKS